jgi:cytoskeleton protein RodZ
MGSFGERLRREREMRGITLDEIAESTRISRRHLESLEKEDFDSLPGGIFNRGFVRSYARYLGIDEDQAVADYAAAAVEPHAETEGKFPLDVPKPDPELNPRRSTLPLILALVALVAVLAIFWARTRSRSAENQESASASVPGATRSPSPTPIPSSTPAPSADTTSDASATAVPTPVATPASSNPATTVQPANVQPSASPAASQSPERQFSVRIMAKEDSWVSVTADGKTVLERILNAGEQQSFRAGKRIVFTTGNAGGVDVSFNGKTLGTIGNESERRVLTFTPSGLVQ